AKSSPGLRNFPGVGFCPFGRLRYHNVGHIMRNTMLRNQGRSTSVYNTKPPLRFKPWQALHHDYLVPSHEAALHPSLGTMLQSLPADSFQ
ncbi:hypothetical protein, partial [Pseudomonas sp. 25 E 4]|uniref:hypothetical protein n=1 Tax=Pseudomonas sp. 25 E 4 TaxID=1844097 RepID=UPI001C400B6E